MNRSQINSTANSSAASATYFQVALILGALLAGTILTRVVPEVRPMAAYVQQTQVIPSTAVFKHASNKRPGHDASRDLTGFDVDLHRLALLGRIS